MCLLVLAWQVHHRYRLIVAANRDEFHERPAAPLAKWSAPNDILAGRDLRAHGTWLGLDRHRRFGVVTSFRERHSPPPDALTRGALVPNYLGGTAGAETFLAHLQPQASRYSGFNLLLADSESLWYASNRANAFAHSLSPGVYGLSNEFLDSPWPKLQRVRRRFGDWLGDPANGTAAGLFALLDDRATATADEELPRTGYSEEWERVLSAPFVLHPDFGTRASTVLLLEPSGAGLLAERRFDPSGTLLGETEFHLAADGRWS